MPYLPGDPQRPVGRGRQRQQKRIPELTQQRCLTSPRMLLQTPVEHPRVQKMPGKPKTTANAWRASQSAPLLAKHQTWHSQGYRAHIRLCSWCSPSSPNHVHAQPDHRHSICAVQQPRGRQRDHPNFYQVMQEDRTGAAWSPTGKPKLDTLSVP